MLSAAPYSRALLCLTLLSVSLSIAPAPNAQESELTAPGPVGPLRGTLRSLAAPHAPVILIIPGSGPTDRNGNSPAGLNASTYRLIAEDLAARGVGSLRVDKRGMFGSDRAIADANAVTLDDYATDIHAWVAVLLKKSGNSCIWIMGHSEGGLVALLAAQNPDHFCGVILLSTPGQSMGKLLREQLKANPANAPLIDQAFTAIDALEHGQHVDTSTLHPALLPLFHPQIQRFLINAFALDPAKLIAQLKLPVLIVQGDRDVQVSVADAHRLKAALFAATLNIIPNANHVWKAVSSDDMGANVATYTDTHLPLAPGLVDALLSFVRQAGSMGR